MGHYGVCPFWLDETRDRKSTFCRIGEIKFRGMEERRLIVFPLCSGRYETCSFYKAMVKAGLPEVFDRENE